MQPSLFRKRTQIGSLLVALQFGLIFLLAALAAPNVWRAMVPVGAVMLVASSVALAAWTLMHNRLGNFNIRPTPKARGSLVTTGPYRWIRHPMYTSVLLGAGALVWTSNTAAGWLAWSALAIVLLVKSILEERWMREQHAGYAAYALQSKRFLPWVF